MTTPRISVHLMVRDGAPALERLLSSVARLDECRGGSVEVCYVDTGSVDGTPDEVARVCRGLGISCSGVAFSHVSRPDLYFKDVPSSYARKLPASCSGGVSCSGGYLLRDWAAARNAGLDLCRGEYVLKVDADDEVDSAMGSSLSLDFLDTRPEVDFLAYPYEVMRPPLATAPGPEYVTSSTRVWRNRPTTRFLGVCHERVDHLRRADGLNWRFLPDGVSFRDHRDLPRQSSSTYFKVLFREYERLGASGEEPPKHLLYYLAEEAKRVDPSFSLEVIDEFVVSSGAVTALDFSMVYLLRGECCEALGKTEEAERWYAIAVPFGTPRAILRRDLIRARRRDEGWRQDLARAVAANRGSYYPRGASLAEVDDALAMLQVDP